MFVAVATRLLYLQLFKPFSRCRFLCFVCVYLCATNGVVGFCWRLLHRVRSSDSQAALWAKTQEFKCLTLLISCNKQTRMYVHVCVGQCKYGKSYLRTLVWANINKLSFTHFYIKYFFYFLCVLLVCMCRIVVKSCWCRCLTKLWSISHFARALSLILPCYLVSMSSTTTYYRSIRWASNEQSVWVEKETYKLRKEHETKTAIDFWNCNLHRTPKHRTFNLTHVPKNN